MFEDVPLHGGPRSTLFATYRADVRPAPRVVTGDAALAEVGKRQGGGQACSAARAATDFSVEHHRHVRLDRMFTTKPRIAATKKNEKIACNSVTRRIRPPRAAWA
jgi:hypothetical protein